MAYPGVEASLRPHGCKHIAISAITIDVAQLFMAPHILVGILVQVEEYFNYISLCTNGDFRYNGRMLSTGTYTQFKRGFQKVTL